MPDDDDEVATRLPFDVNCVKYFYLHFLVLEESYDLSHILCCIRSFPYLEYLEIQVLSASTLFLLSNFVVIFRIS